MADDENTIVRDPNDWLLEFLVDLADWKKVELLITLQIGGMLVSGILASGEVYFDAVRSQLSEIPKLKKARFFYARDQRQFQQFRPYGGEVGSRK